MVMVMGIIASFLLTKSAVGRLVAGLKFRVGPNLNKIKKKRNKVNGEGLLIWAQMLYLRLTFSLLYAQFFRLVFFSTCCSLHLIIMQVVPRTKPVLGSTAD